MSTTGELRKTSSKSRIQILLLVVLALLAACTMELEPGGGSDSGGSAVIGGGETARVTDIIDGDTIDVDINGVGYRVRYIGVNTPESDESCYDDATDANANLVAGQTVTLVRDSSNTDRFGRLLRYVYVGNLFVNAQLVQDGWAEAVEYPPDTANADYFHQLETQAARSNIGCHPTAIFDDGSDVR